MAKKKDLVIQNNERFVIPQINHSTVGLMRKKEGFRKSKVASPYHGTNVLDNVSYYDNSGSVDISYNYDFVREKEEKHLSDDELIRRHGTKYYEFGVGKKDRNEEIYLGSDYKNKVNNSITNPKEKKNFSFIDDVDSIVNPEVSVVEKKRQNMYNQNFVFDIPDDDDDNFAYEKSSFSFKKEDDYKQQFNWDGIPSSSNEDLSEEITIDPRYENSGLNMNQTIEEAMSNVGSFTWEEVDPKILNSAQQAVYQFQQFQSQEQPTFTYENMPEDESTDDNATTYQQDYSQYLIPYHKFLEKSKSHSDEIPQWLEEKKEVINHALSSFQIDGEVVNYTKGPAFTRYEIMLGAGVNVKKIGSIYENLQAALQATSIRLQIPIPGKNTVGIEVPNDVAEIVPFGDIVNDEFINDNKLLNVAMGKNIDGTPYYLNITEMPHALIAGSTQSGKSVSINAILLSLILKNSPETLKLILIDPKKVELNFYNDLPHLITPVIDDPSIASESLKWAVEEMERRFNILAVTKSRDLSDYRKKRKINSELENLPAIVIIVDEFNDLMMQCGQEANDSIIRLAQKGRACGIHIILATQRPTVDVVNGTIKANINCRIAFRVSSDVDSRTILDESGAENLLGRGDVLIKNQGAPIRAQGAYVSVDEITAICDYITARYEPDFYFTHLELKKKMNRSTFGGGKDAPQEDKAFLYKVAQACVQQGMCSINFIQNNFNVGFNRAHRIVTILEGMEIISGKNSTKNREILVDSYRLREIFEMD